MTFYLWNMINMKHDWLINNKLIKFIAYILGGKEKERKSNPIPPTNKIVYPYVPFIYEDKIIFKLILL